MGAPRWVRSGTRALCGTTGLTATAGDSSVALSWNSSDGSWNQTQPTGLVYHYDSGGILRYLSNPSGNRWSYTYDSGGRLTSL